MYSLGDKHWLTTKLYDQLVKFPRNLNYTWVNYCGLVKDSVIFKFDINYLQNNSSVNTYVCKVYIYICMDAAISLGTCK